MTRSAALRYALAPACIALAALLHLSPASAFLHPTGPFVIAVLAAAWFGGVGPGVAAAVLSTFALPQLVAPSYPLVGGFFDLPRFITFTLIGLAVGLGAARSRRAEAALRQSEQDLEKKLTERAEALRESEQRYARAMEATEAGHWEWDLVKQQVFHSPRFRELYGVSPEETFTDREAWKARQPVSRAERERQEQALQAAIADPTKSYDIELSFEVRPGEIRWLRSRGKVFRAEDGRPLRVTGATTDITARKLAEEALRLSEERYALAMQASGEGHWDWKITSGEFYASPRWREISGFAPDEPLGARAQMLARYPFHPEDRPKYVAAVAAHFAGAIPRVDLELRIMPHGRLRWAKFTGMCLRDAAGAPVRYAGSIMDITEQKRAEKALRESEERYERAMEGSDAGHWDWNIVSDEMFVSERAREMLALPAGTLPKRRSEIMALVPQHPDDRAGMEGKVAAGIATGAHERDYRVIPRAGEVRWLRARAKVFKDARGAALRMTGSLTDITERKLAADELRESEARFRSLTELSSDWFWRQDENLRFTYMSDQAAALGGFSPESSIGKLRWELPGVTPLSSSWAEHQAVHDARQPFRDLELSRQMPDGSLAYYSISGAPIFDEQGRFKGYQGIGRSITERKRMEAELRQSEARFRALTELSSDWYWRQDENLRFTFVSHQVADTTAYPREWVIGKTRAELPGITLLSSSWAEHQALLAARQPFRDLEYARVGRDGRNEYVSVSGAPIFDEQGVFRGYQGIGRNLTERKRIEEELKAMERKLRQAQRLEAMGTLAGGIAHDFNNILGAILGYGEMAMRDAAKGSRLRRDLDSILVAGERGRALVDRVLAFSRSGVGERVAVHVEKVVREALDLLAAKLPPNVTLHAKLHSGPAAMLGDATQVHQVLMNLATNAIQAMPLGGTLRVSLDALRIEAARAPSIGTLAPGEYLVLQVADTGTGIAPEIVDRIFDPFFTTKEVGTGTGLGLSLVHGIVAEVGGAVDVASTPGAGSVFTVYLPRSGDALDSLEKEEPQLPRGDGQRVLIVDDEEPLVRLATRTLEELGYMPTGFTSSAAALAAFRADPQRFDALITDERMPGMSGSALIREVRGIRDRMPIVLMSGFVGGAVALRAREAGAEEVLKKPLSARDLAASLARVLHP